MKVLAYPSKAYAEKLRSTEEDRLKKQRDDMGEDGLRKAGENVKLAVESQKLPPNDVLVKVPVADVGGIVFRRLKSYDLANNEEEEGAPGGFDLK